MSTPCRRKPCIRAAIVPLGAALWSFIGYACAPNLSTMAPARITPPGHLQLTSSLDGTLTSGELGNAVSDVKDSLAKNTSQLTADQIRRLIDGATVLLVQPPAAGFQLSLAYGLSKRFEVSARSSINAARAGVRFQFLRESPGIYGVIGVFGSLYLYGIPVNQLTKRADLNSFGRRELDVPLHIGFSNRYVHLWAGPKFVLSSYDARASVCLEDETPCSNTAQTTVSGTATYWTGQAGVAVGYRQFWVAFELTVGQASIAADVDIASATLSERHHVARKGMVLAPAVGIISWF